jgi:hypothetical protein
MLTFPQSTEYVKRIPKTRFYEHLSVGAEIKRLFIDQINTIIWLHKFSPETLALVTGKRVKEIQIIQIKLNQKEIDQRVLSLIDKGIPYHLVFLLTHQDQSKLCMAFKEKTTNKEHYGIGRYFETPWLNDDQISLEINGLDLDVVCDNFLRQIAGNALNTQENGTVDLKDTIEKQDVRDKLKKQIVVLEKKRDNEKQFNRQVELNAELRKLKEMLNCL